MYPVIYDFGVVDLFGFQFRLAIYSFGLMLVAAFYTCYFLLDKDLRELGYDEKLASDIIFWSALGGIVGSKVYHVIENLDQIMSSNNPMSLISVRFASRQRRKGTCSRCCINSCSSLNS